MIELQQVCVEGGFHRASFQVRAGTFAAVVTGAKPAGEALVRLLLGLDRAESGRVSVFGYDLATVSCDQLYHLRRNIGVVHPGGGLISNLSLRENISLQAAYFGVLDQPELILRTDEALRRVGYQGNSDELPGNLSVNLRKLAGFARVLLALPDLVIYHATFEDLQASDRERLVRVAKEFHHEKEERTSLVICSPATDLNGLPIDDRYQLG